MKYKILRNIGLSFIRMGQYQDAVQAFDSVVENVPDHIAAFNLVVCMYALGDHERMQTAFLKLLEVQSKLDFHEEEEENGNDISLQADELQKDLRRRRNDIYKCILMAARLIAPKISPGKVTEGYDWIISKLTMHGHTKLANQMDMAK